MQSTLNLPSLWLRNCALLLREHSLRMPVLHVSTYFHSLLFEWATVAKKVRVPAKPERLVCIFK